MTETQGIIAAFFRETLKIDVGSVDEDLIEQGRLDSLGLVELIFFLEGRFDMTIDLAQIELVQLSSMAALGRLVDERARVQEKPFA